MIRNLKALGLMAFAALAMSAMFASAASGQTKGVLTAGHNEATPVHTDATVVGNQYDLEDENWNFFETPNTETQVKCHEALFTGTLDEGGTSHVKGKSGSTGLTITPHYEECWTGTNTPVTVDMGDCDYVFTQPTSAGEGTYTGKADLTCEGSSVITLTVYLFGTTTNGNPSFPLCTIEVFPNAEEEEGHTTEELGGHLIYTPVEEGSTTDHLTVKADISGISYKDNCQSDEDTNAIYKQTVTVKALEDGGEPHTEQLGLWISEEEEE